MPDKNYTGIDITPKMIRVAKAKNLERVDWVVGDCENLPFDDDSLMSLSVRTVFIIIRTRKNFLTVFSVY